MYLDRNQFTALPESVGKLTALSHLRLTGNELTALPETFFEFTALRHLHLRHNLGLSVQPATFDRFTNLLVLQLD